MFILCKKLLQKFSMKFHITSGIILSFLLIHDGLNIPRNLNNKVLKKSSVFFFWIFISILPQNVEVLNIWSITIIIFKSDLPVFFLILLTVYLVNEIYDSEVFLILKSGCKFIELYNFISITLVFIKVYNVKNSCIKAQI